MVAPRRLLALSSLTVAVLAGGLPSGCTAGPGPMGEPFMSIIPATTARSLSSDGVAAITMEVNAFGADGAADNSQVTVTATRGELSSPGAAMSAQPSIVVTPTAGNFTVSYRCALFDSGEITIRAENASTSAELILTCIPPGGGLQIQFDSDADCQGPGDAVTARPGNTCDVQGTVLISLGGTDVPQAMVSVRAEVPEDGLVSVILPDGTMGDANSPDATRNVLSANGMTAGRNSSVTVTTDDEGRFTFYFHATNTLNLRQTVRVNVTATSPIIDGDVSTTLTLSTAEFVNLSDLDVVAAPVSVVGGDTVDVTVTPKNLDGNAPASGTMTVELNDPEASTSLMDATITLNGDESYPFQVTTPTLQTGDPPRTLEITVTYPVVDGGILSTTASVSVNAPGTLLLNAAADPTLFYSDRVGAEAQTTITATLEKDEAPSQLPVTFSVRQADVERIGLVDPPGGTALANSAVVTPDAEGIATVVVRARNNLVRGIVFVTATVVDNQESPPRTYTRDVQIEVDRAPVLQSIVWNSSTPDVIGVKGSSTTSSSAVSFTIYDDLNQPMANVPVEFSVPETADPEASVEANKISGADGTVTTNLAAGTRAQSISVRATATFGGNSLTVVSPPISVVGGSPNFSNSYLTCTPGEVIQIAPFTSTCQVTLADRFTNTAPPLNVQYRAEGGNITATVVGSADATFVSGTPGPGYVDAAAWSYGLALPFSAAELSDPVEYASCFDGTSATPCNLLKMCVDGLDDPFCVLPSRGATGVLDGCWEDVPGIALAFLGIEAGGCTVTGAPPAQVDINCPGFSPITLPATGPNPGQVSGYLYGIDANVRAAVEVYKDAQNACGFPLSCLSGLRDVFPSITSDDCPVAAGCFDFVGNTPCPSNSLLTITASVRGEEGFVDENGDGIFSYTDLNGNGEHDPGEPSEDFIDLPETFLDKNDNCYFDQFQGSIRMETTQEIQNSDLFSDEDQSGDFGYEDPADPNARTLANGRFDRDKELFFQARLLGLTSGVSVPVGELCYPDENGLTTCSDGSTAVCVERSVDPYGNAYGFAPGCLPNRLVHPDVIAASIARGDNVYDLNDVQSFDLSYTFLDANGNCHDSGSSKSYTLQPEGSVTLLGTTDGDMEPLCHGLSVTGNGVNNQRRPWCDETRGLGASAVTVGVSLDCADGDEKVATAKIAFDHTQYPGPEYTYGVTVVCPACGDGYRTGDEQCDPAAPIGQGGDANCTPDCKIEVPQAP